MALRHSVYLENSISEFCIIHTLLHKETGQPLKFFICLIPLVKAVIKNIFMKHLCFLRIIKVVCRINSDKAEIISDNSVAETVYGGNICIFSKCQLLYHRRIFALLTYILKSLYDLRFHLCSCSSGKCNH